MNIYCPHCQQILEIPDDLFGHTVQCSTCNGLINIPVEFTNKNYQEVPKNKIYLRRKQQSLRTNMQRLQLPLNKSSKGFIYGLLISLIISMLLIVYLVSPYYSIHNIKKIIDKKDPVALSGYIDYPRLRESLKATLKAQMIKATTETMANSADDELNGWAAIGGTLATMMIGPMIDATITPEGLTMLMQGKSVNGYKDNNILKKISYDQDIRVIKMGYEGLNNFIIQVQPDPNENNFAIYVLTRNNLFCWKLTGIHLRID